jgi:hypothetical protein
VEIWELLAYRLPLVSGQQQNGPSVGRIKAQFIGGVLANKNAKKR